MLANKKEMGTPASELGGNADTPVGQGKATIKLDKDYNFTKATNSNGENQNLEIIQPTKK